jgi:hypothetical protein
VASRQLVVLGCSAAKTSTEGAVPAVNLYDGPAFRVLRAFVRTHRWPHPLSMAALWAKDGLIGGLAPIAPYDLRMTPDRARELNPRVTATLRKFAVDHKRIERILDLDYRASISLDSPNGWRLPEHHFVDGPIGIKLNYLRSLLHRMPRKKAYHPVTLPKTDVQCISFPIGTISSMQNSIFHPTNFHARKELAVKKNTFALMRQKRIADGVLVSLAQHLCLRVRVGAYFRSIGNALRILAHTYEPSAATAWCRKYFEIEEVI